MSEHKENIPIQKIVNSVHVILYVLTILFQVQLIIENKGIRYHGLAEANVAIFAILLILGLVTRSLKPKVKNEKKRLKFQLQIVLKIIQLLNAYVLYFAFEGRVGQGLGLVFIILFATELLYTMKFEEFLQRFLAYVIMIVPYEVLLSFFALGGSGKYEEKLREIIISSVLFIYVIFVGEILNIIWKYFQNCILKQSRTLESLNESNEELKVQQEKINRVNEMLGLQKVQLQAANKLINAAHQESMVQNAIANVTSTSLELNELICSLCETIKKKMKTDFIAIIVDSNIQRRANEEAPSRYATYLSNISDEFDRWFVQMLKSNKLEQVFKLNNTYMENDSRISPILGEEGAKYIKSLIILPLTNHASNAGHLIIGSTKEYTFSDNKAFYETIAGQISMGVTNATLYQKMREMAIRDGLTGIYNRRHLTEEVDRYVKEAMESGKSVSLALFDIDKFKMINDTHGHLFGDAVIRDVAKMLNKKANKNNGLAGRYGGEEFVLAFPGKTLQQTYELIKEVHEEIRSATISMDGKSLQVRVSAGISSFPETCKNPNEILTRADWAMYHSKRNGRDQITVDSENITAKM